MVKRLELRIIIRVIFLFATLFATTFILLKGWHTYLALIAPVIIYQLIELYRFQHKSQEEIKQFVESVHYRDFSR